MENPADRCAPAPTLICLSHCTGCGACVAACPLHALSLASSAAEGRGRKSVAVDTARCTVCGACRPACPRQALVIVTAPSRD